MTADPLPLLPSDARVVFATGTGRCGTQFLVKVLGLEPRVAAWHERNPLGDSFHRYCLANELPVDQSGFLAEKRDGIVADLEDHDLSFESSSYLALSCRLLFERFHAKFILLTRRPDRVVNSYIKKGWFEQPLHREDPALAAGYQPAAERPHHPFSRLVPTGPEGATWDHYTRVGKIAWSWKMLNGRVLEQFADLPDEHWRVVQLEQLSYQAYGALCDFMGFVPHVTARQFDDLVAARPNALRPTRGVHDWSAQEALEFESEVAAMSEQLGYPWRVEELRASAPPAPAVATLRASDQPATSARSLRPRRGIGRLLRSFAKRAGRSR